MFFLMSLIAYTISSQLKDYLNKTDSVRARIHLHPLSPKEEYRARWEAQTGKIYWSLSLAEVPINKDLLLQTLTSPSAKPSRIEREIVNYKKALDYLKFEWLGSKEKITSSTIHKLYDIACKPTLGTSEIKFKSKKKLLNHFLDYLQAGEEHPIVQAGVAYIQIYTISPFTDGIGRLARLTADLFLYKHAYDFRGLLVYEEAMGKDILALRQARESVARHNTLTLWLEYFAYVVGVSADSAARNIQQDVHATKIRSSFWKLNKRQKEILASLDNPDAKISNSDVQGKFKVSQITASRDLTKLTNLGLLVARGEGRSRYYVRGPII